MSPAQRCLFVLAHVLLLLALQGHSGPLPALLASGGALAALLGLAQALGTLPGGAP